MRLPNIITLGRLLSVPLTIWFILDGRTDIAFWVFAAAGASDAIDGFIAKHFDQVSELGRFLDPIADKVLLVSIFLTLGQLGYLPLWLVILVVSRDALIVGGAVFSFVLKLPFAGWPMMISKVNTVGQIVLAGAVLATVGLGVDFGMIPELLVYAVAVTTVVSGGWYIVRWAGTASGSGEIG